MLAWRFFYTVSTSILEVAAVAQDLRAWAKSVPERKKQTKHSAWLQDPEDEAKFFAAVAKNIKEDNKNETRAPLFGDFEGPADDSSSSPALRSTPGLAQARRRAAKARRARRPRPRRRRRRASTARRTRPRRRPQQQQRAPRRARVVSKKRKPSAGATGSKDKKVKKAAPAESESASSQQSPAKTVDKTKDLCSVWPLSELQAFEEKAAQQATAAGAAGLEVEQRLALTKELPAAVRKLVW